MSDLRKAASELVVKWRAAAKVAHSIQQTLTGAAINGCADALEALLSTPADAPRASLLVAPVNDFEYHAGKIIRRAVEHDADKMRFYLTVSVGELAQRIARLSRPTTSEPGNA